MHVYILPPATVRNTKNKTIEVQGGVIFIVSISMFQHIQQYRIVVYYQNILDVTAKKAKK
jgi:hypothetical protein